MDKDSIIRYLGNIIYGKNQTKKHLSWSNFLIHPLLAAMILGVIGCSRDETSPRELIYDFVGHLNGAYSYTESNYIDFGDDKYRPNLSKGWGSAEQSQDNTTTWVWATSNEAVLTIFLSEQDAKTNSLSLRCWPMKHKGGSEQAMDIYINDRFISNIVLDPSAKLYKLAIPENVLASGKNIIKFQFNYAISPAMVSKSNDRRSLAVAFDYLHVGNNMLKNAKISKPEVNEAEALVQPAYSAIVYPPIVMPRDAVLRFELLSGTIKGDGHEHLIGQIRIIHNKGSEVIFRHAVDTEKDSFVLDLKKYVNQTLQFEFTVEEKIVSAEDPGGRLIWKNIGLYGNAAPVDIASNVIFIVVDTLRADHLATYGAPFRTPNIDKLAKRGIVFDQAYSHIPITGPSHSSIFTSLFPSDHGVHNNTQILDASFHTLPEFMQEHYRRTAGFVSLGVLKGEYGFSQGFGEYFDTFSGEWFKTAAEINKEALAWLEKNYQYPFFLFLHYSDPHEPYGPPNDKFPHIAASINGTPVRLFPADGTSKEMLLKLEPGENRLKLAAEGETEPASYLLRNWNITHKSVTVSWPAEKRKPDDQGMIITLPREIIILNQQQTAIEVILKFRINKMLSVEETREKYREEVQYVDTEIGKFLSKISELELLDNTLIVFTSDHGEGLGDHGEIGHINQLYNSLIRVPLIISFGDRLQEQRRIEQPVRHIDLLPTILELLNIKIPSGIRGKSLVKLMNDEGEPENNILSETYKPEAQHNRKATIMNGFKYIFTESDGHEEIYNLMKDPTESNNLIYDHDEIAFNAREYLGAIDKNAFAERIVSKKAVLSEQDREKLRSLGYVH